MKHTIFFSWQVDTPPTEGRNLIERALQRAVARIGDDTSIEEAARDVEIDSDTKGVPGSPPIVETIFKKIDKATLFAPDLTFVATRPDGRPSPNPNVMIEYGWALKSLGYNRIVPVQNTAFGEPSPTTLPFDLGYLRYPIAYHCPTGAEDAARKAAKEDLAKKLENAVRTFFESEEFQRSLPRPPAPKLFVPREPKNGQGRFRVAGEPLGTSGGPFDTSSIDIRLADGSAMWLRLMPLKDPERQWYLTDLEAAGNPQRGGKILMPLTQRQSEYDFVRAEDGFGWYGIRNERTLTSAVTFAFTTGEVWGIDSAILDLGNDRGRRVIPNVVDVYVNALAQYSDFLARLGARGPFKWIAGMENLKGRGLAILPPPNGAPTFSTHGSCVAEVVTVEGVHTTGDPPMKSLRPFFAKLYDSCAIPLSQWFDN